MLIGLCYVISNPVRLNRRGSSTVPMFYLKKTNKQTNEERKKWGGGLFELEWLSAFPLYSVNAHLNFNLGFLFSLFKSILSDIFLHSFWSNESSNRTQKNKIK